MEHPASRDPVAHQDSPEYRERLEQMETKDSVDQEYDCYIIADNDARCL